MERAFSYGFLSIILAIYLKQIGFDDILIGVIKPPKKSKII